MAEVERSAFSRETPEFPITRPDYTQPSPDDAAGAKRRQRRALMLGLGFLAPNILGFLTFTAIPLVFSMVMAFTNWDLALHNNPEGRAPLRWVGLEHFQRLIGQRDFWRFLGNTLFFMMGMPFSIAASLGAAMLLSKDLRGGSRRIWMMLLAGAVLMASVIMLAAAGAGGTGMLLLLSGVAGGMMIVGVAGGSTVYRTLFYVPHFTSGVATLLLWKKLYNPTSGPITNALQPVLNQVSGAVNGMPSWVVMGIFWGCVALVMLVLLGGLRRIRLYWEEGDLGAAGVGLSLILLLIPLVAMVQWYGLVDRGWAVAESTEMFVRGEQPWNVAMAWLWDPFITGAIVLVAAGVALVVINAILATKADKTFVVKRPWHGVGTGIMFAAFAMVAMFALVGLGGVFGNLPEWASKGLSTPKWLQDVYWAKPSLMIMGFWGAIGSNTMLLYLAALTNVPIELYEAADIDGASRFQKFWNVTWPQLAPTTFFIVVMGVIGGLQGGFDMVRVMTSPPGGPAGTTTTLSYFIYTEGFETGRLGFSSAVAWTLFLLVLMVTLFNWKFGNKYVND